VVDIEKIKKEIIDRLIPLNPDKIILFGSYAYGTPTEDSDIDLFLLKDDLTYNNSRKFRVDAKMKLHELISKYKIGFDVLSSSTNELKSREDYFYKVDILQNGMVLYERSSS
jgi:predicted nucleotidyltransferase